MKTLFTIFILFPIFIYSQNKENSSVFLTISNESKLNVIINHTNLKADNYTKLDSILNVSNFISIEKAIDFKTGIEKLDNWYIIKHNGNSKEFRNNLIELNDNYLLDIELAPKVINLASSNDYFEVNSSPLLENRALNLINASKAWDIRKNNTAVIAVSGESEYQGHEDLISNVNYQEYIYSSSPYSFHGTAVAGCAGGVTNNNLGLASAGYNPKVLLYSSSLDNQMSKLIDALNRGAKVVTISQGSLDYNSYYQSIIDYGYNLGVTFVAGAGNGPSWENQFLLYNSTCDKDNFGDNLSLPGSGECLVYPASFNHVISVTSVSHSNMYGVPVYLNIPSANLLGYYNYLWKDVHEQFTGNAASSHNHNSKIDICAPGYSVPALYYDINNKYTNVWGTSFAAPMVASAISLILSVNPCLTPDDIEYIIKTTAFNIYSITENQSYIGKLGAGRLDLFAAINLAQTYKANYIQNISFSLTNQIIKGHTIIVGSSVTSSTPVGAVTILSGADITFNSRQYIELKPGFEAQQNSTFYLNVDENFIPCP